VDFIFLILLVLMLLLFGYAQFKKDVVKTPGTITEPDEEKIEFY
jgi:hypothetical protein